MFFISLFNIFFYVLISMISIDITYCAQPAETYTVPTLQDLETKLSLTDPSDNLPMSNRVISNKALLAELAPILSSRSVEYVGAFLKNDAIDFAQRKELLESIISDMSYGFSHDDAVQLILDVANGYTAGSKEQDQLFDILLSHKDILKKSSPLFIAIKNDYTHTYLSLLSWSIKNAASMPDLKHDLAELKMRALKRAVEIGNASIIQKIHDFTDGITKEEATALVWFIVRTGNHPELLPLIAKFGADLNQVQGKQTPLIAAVDNGFFAVVQQLIDLKANLDKIADPEYGTPLQRAITNRDAQIEGLLRKAGARE